MTNTDCILIALMAFLVGMVVHDLLWLKNEIRVKQQEVRILWLEHYIQKAIDGIQASTCESDFEEIQDVLITGIDRQDDI